MATEETTETDASLIAGAIERRLRDLSISMPAKVTRYDEARGEIDAQPLIHRRRETEDGSTVAERLPIVPSVPVVWPGAGGYRLTFPLAVGDVVLLVFASASLDRWLQRGGEIDPGETRFGALSDAIAIPGLQPFSSPWTGAATDHATLGRDGGAQIHLRASTITIGDESGAQFLALANLVYDALSDLATTIAAWVPVPNDGGLALKTALVALFTGPPVWPPSVAATQAKGK